MSLRAAAMKALFDADCIRRQQAVAGLLEVLAKSPIGYFAMQNGYAYGFSPEHKCWVAEVDGLFFSDDGSSLLVLQFTNDWGEFHDLGTLGELIRSNALGTCPPLEDYVEVPARSVQE